MTNLKIITVVNDFDCFEKTIKSNRFMNRYQMFIFDNVKENLSITRRYNSFLEDQIFSKKINDSWLVFCHQDFAFLEDPLEILEKENPQNILGIIGAHKAIFPIFKNRKKLKGNLWQGLGNFIKPNPDFKSDEFEIFNTKFKIINGTAFLKTRKKTKHGFVDTVDCCCLIVHSSTIQKYNLRFDEKLLWDMYAEDFCLNAKFNHKIRTRTTPIESYHISLGSTKGENFFQALSFVRTKYSQKKIFGTCAD